MKILAIVLSITLMQPGIASLDGGGGKRKKNKRANYQKFEREEVRSYRAVNNFEMPAPIPMFPEIVTPQEPQEVSSINLDHYFRNGNTVYIENDNRLNEFVRIDRKVKSDTRYRKGYRVQIYQGSSRSRASSVQQKALRLYSEYNPQMQFYDRKYRVKIGNFILKQDANLFRKELLWDFEGAFVVPDKIEVPKPGR